MPTFTYASTDLSTFGKVTTINEYLSTPDRRGDNVQVPFRHGTSFVPKYYDERTLTFGIAVIATSATELETTFDSMRALFATGIEQELAMTMEDTSVRYAYASVVSAIEVERVTGTLARVVVEMVLSKPFFTGGGSDQGETMDASPKTFTVTNTGTVDERNPTITLTGPLTNVAIENTTNSCLLTYTGIIADGESVEIGTRATGEFYAVMDSVTNVIDKIGHSGASALMVLDVGENAFSVINDDTTTGTVSFYFFPPYA